MSLLSWGQLAKGLFLLQCPWKLTQGGANYGNLLLLYNEEAMRHGTEQKGYSNEY